MIETVVSSSALILLILVIRKVFKGKIRLWLQYSLWLVVLLRLMLPFSIGKSVVSIMNYIALPQLAATDVVMTSTTGQGSYNSGAYDDQFLGDTASKTSEVQTQNNTSKISEVQIQNNTSKISEVQTQTRLQKQVLVLQLPMY